MPAAHLLVATGLKVKAAQISTGAGCEEEAEKLLCIYSHSPHHQQGWRRAPSGCCNSSHVPPQLQTTPSAPSNHGGVPAYLWSSQAQRPHIQVPGRPSISPARQPRAMLGDRAWFRPHHGHSSWPHGCNHSLQPATPQAMPSS